jgi:dihydrofolate reductase
MLKRINMATRRFGSRTPSGRWTQRRLRWLSSHSEDGGAVAEAVAAALATTDKDAEIGGAGLAAAAATNLGLVDELRMFRHPIIVGGGTPFLPPVTESGPLELIETRTFGSHVIYERYRRISDDIE